MCLTNSMAFIAVLCIFDKWSMVASRNITIGVLVPRTGHRSYGQQMELLSKYAVDKINSDQNLTGLRSHDIEIQFVTGDTKCDVGTGLVEMIQMIGSSLRISGMFGGFIGPACDDVCDASGYVAASWNVPIISYACAYRQLSSVGYHRTFASTSTTYSGMINALIDVMHLFKWDRVALARGHQNVWIQTSEEFAAAFELAGLSHDLWTLEDNLVLYEKHFIYEMQNQRILVICAYANEVIHLMCTAKKLGYLTGEYAFITIDYAMSFSADTYECDLGVAMEGILDITLYAWLETPPDIMAILEANNITDTVHGGLLYDSFRLYAEALDNTLNDGFFANDTAEIIKRIRNITFTGIGGPVYINENGTRQSTYVLHNIKQGKYLTIGTANGSVGSLHFLEAYNIVWPGGTTVPPLGRPICDWDGSLCKETEDSVLIPAVTSSITIITLVFVAAVVGLRYWQKKQKQAAAMYNMSWMIHSLDLVMDTSSDRTFASKASKSTDFSRASGDSDLSNKQQKFAQVHRFNGLLIASKSINKNYIAITDNIIKEMNMLRSLKHTNVNSLVGAICEPLKLSIISEYCNKGSLQDVLENDNIKLDWIFKVSFASDIARGMEYIHRTPIDCHGRLKSSNVFIDSHWICKIGDFSMPFFREGEKPLEGKHAFYFGFLWTAPEILREDNIDNFKGTKKGDVYSFAIILHEIIMRMGPFGFTTEEPYEIIERVKKCEHPPYRPQFPNDATSSQLLDLMRICWEEIAMFRPNFTTIMATLKKTNKGKKTNLVDQMIHMMEMHAEHLEDMVDERTRQLGEEKRKTEELLSRMLPRSVAENLKMGKTIIPEMFEEVTVFFSDIVGFTDLSSTSNPTQIVDFLNDLYICFDTIIENHDVYKVETIGDAYMVVSGLPKRNGAKHAGEIATLALHLLSSVITFKIRHRPDRQLQLRIGIHSGPVAAGVVGLKMPRYCLFGDTVNYASRMESTGEALRIHISPFTKARLDGLGGYRTVRRGVIPVKGIGDVETFYLTGKLGFVKELPNQTPSLVE